MHPHLPVLVAAVALLAGCSVPVPTALPDRDGAPPAEVAPATPAPGAPLGATMALHVLDVGQGDAMLIVAPNGRAMLVDGGPRGAGDEIIAYLDAQQIARLEVVVATHGDADHIGGFGTREANVLDRFPPERVYEPGFPKTTSTYATFLDAARRANATVLDADDVDVGDRIPLDEANVTITFLHPVAVDPAGEPNDEGFVLRVEMGDFVAILPGDASAKVERDLLARGHGTDVTLLKVGHHGSRSSTSVEWLAALKPEISIVSVAADNTYGHPHADTLARLEASGTTLYRTDSHGDVVVLTNGSAWTVTPSR